MRLALLSAVLLTACGFDAPTRLVHEEALVLDATGLDAARLIQGMGDAVVQGHDTEEVVLEIRLLGPDVVAADEEVIGDLQVALDACGTRACARSEMSEAHPRYALRTRLLVPARFMVRVEDGLGELDVSGVAAAEIVDGSGDLDVHDIAGDLDVDDDLGDLHISGIGGDLVLTDGSGSADVFDVHGAATIDDDLGDLDIGRTGPLTVRDHGGDLDVQDIVGDVDIVDDLGDLRVIGVEGDVRVVDESGNIRVEDVTGHVHIDDGSGDITVLHAGSLEVASDSTGEVRTQDVGDE